MSHHAPAVRAQDPTLANRYGTDHTRPGRRRLWAGLGGLGLVVAVLLSVWIGLNMSVGAIEYKDVAAFLILIVVLIFMPTGLLGRPEVEKV